MEKNRRKIANLILAAILFVLLMCSLSGAEEVRAAADTVYVGKTLTITLPDKSATSVLWSLAGDSGAASIVYRSGKTCRIKGVRESSSNVIVHAQYMLRNSVGWHVWDCRVKVYGVTDSTVVTTKRTTEATTAATTKKETTEATTAAETKEETTEATTAATTKEETTEATTVTTTKEETTETTTVTTTREETTEATTAETTKVETTEATTAATTKEETTEATTETKKVDSSVENGRAFTGIQNSSRKWTTEIVCDYVKGTKQWFFVRKGSGFDSQNGGYAKYVVGDSSVVRLEFRRYSRVAGEWSYYLYPLKEGKTYVDFIYYNSDDVETEKLRLTVTSQCTTCSGSNPQRTKIIAGKKATCTESGTTDAVACRACGRILTPAEEIAPLGHQESEWKVKTAATTKHKGKKVKICTRCQTVLFTESIPKLEEQTSSETSILIKNMRVKCKGAALSKKRVITIKKGKKASLSVTCLSGNTTPKLKFKSSNPKIVSVNGKGKIVAKRKGTARITVVSGKTKIVLKVRVK